MRKLCHRALWSVPAAVVAVAALLLAAAAIWSAPKDWAAARWSEILQATADPVIAVLLCVLALAWVIALVWTGLEERPTKVKAPVSIPFHKAARFIAKDSAWAAGRRERDDENYVSDIDRDLTDALTLGHVRAYGRQKLLYRPKDLGKSEIPKDFWLKGGFDPQRLLGSGPPMDYARKNTEDGGEQYFEVVLSSEDVFARWPKRDWLSAMRRRSPAERTGAVKSWEHPTSESDLARLSPEFDELDVPALSRPDPAVAELKKAMEPLLKERREQAKAKAIRTLEAKIVPMPKPGDKWPDARVDATFFNIDRGGHVTTPLTVAGVQIVPNSESDSEGAAIKANAIYCTLQPEDADRWADGRGKQRWHLHNAAVRSLIRRIEQS